MATSSTANIGQLYQIQEMLIQLVENISTEAVQQQFHPEMASIGWYLGQSVYLETYLIREVLQKDNRMTARVQHLFAHDVTIDQTLLQNIPPKEHLLNWAKELQEDNLTRLANPTLLGKDLSIDPVWLVRYLIQIHALTYEKILVALQNKTLLEINNDFLVSSELLANLTPLETSDISQGHYRIGARDNEIVFNNEQPAQMVELSNFRIAKKPVSNENYLTFMNDQGYNNKKYWSEKGWQWAQQSNKQPWHWRKNKRGLWFSIGINGASDIPATDPVMGINHYEAHAYSQWLSHQDPSFMGAALQHEYQWETAARQNLIQQTGKVREWCANTPDAYDGYKNSPIHELNHFDFNDQLKATKGVSLHSQPSIRRTSLRLPLAPHHQHWLTGMRLIFPPGKPFWEQ